MFDERLRPLPGTWAYVQRPMWLERTVLELKPRLVFVLHWRWRILPVVLGATNYVGFHLGPFRRYRGGTPLQHQIVDGRTDSDLTIYRMTKEMDAGPVYSTIPIMLHGSAEAIYARAMGEAARWITGVVDLWHRDGMDLWEPTEEQLGPWRPRRWPEMGGLPCDLPLERVYDHVRMLDAEGYPHAFLDHGPYRLTLRRAVLYDGRVECDCTITVREEETK